jgi:hypothetical protein
MATMKMRLRRRVFKSELRISIQLLLGGGGHQQHCWSLPAAAVVVLVVVGRVSRSASHPNAGGRKRWRRDRKGLVVAVLETRVNSRGKPDLFVFACYSGGYVCVCSRPPVEGGYPLRRYQSQGEFTPPTPATSYPRQTPHQPLAGEMLADGYPLGNVDGTATANLVVTIPWSPTDILPGASLCDT